MKKTFIIFIFIMFIISGCNRTKSLVNPSGDTNKETTVPITDTPSPSPTYNVPSDAQIIVEEPLLVKREPNYKALAGVVIATIACIYAVNKYYDTPLDIDNTLPIGHGWQAMTAQQQFAWAAEYYGINYNQDVPLYEVPEYVEPQKQQELIECPRF